MNMLSIKEVSKQYNTHLVLDRINIDVSYGSILGLLGPNGAGKTSLIRIITQIIVQDSGEVWFHGERLSDKHVSMVGYLPEERGLYKKMAVGEQLIYLSRLKGLSKSDAKTKVGEWMDKFGIQDWWHRPVEELSKGMQQKVQFIAAVIHEPKLIILDEPFSGFDPLNANLLKDEILNLRQSGSTIIFSTHRMESVEELCDDVAMIDRAKIVLQGKKSAIRAEYNTHTYMIESDMAVVEVSDGFEIISSFRTSSERSVTEIKCLTKSANELIIELSGKVSIYSFAEKIPNLNKIFIDLVNRSTELPMLASIAAGQNSQK